MDVQHEMKLLHVMFIYTARGCFFFSFLVTPSYSHGHACFISFFCSISKHAPLSRCLIMFSLHLHFASNRCSHPSCLVQSQSEKQAWRKCLSSVNRRKWLCLWPWPHSKWTGETCLMSFANLFYQLELGTECLQSTFVVFYQMACSTCI